MIAFDIFPTFFNRNARLTDMNLTEVLNDPPKPHKNSEGGFMVWGLTEAALKFIYENIDDKCITLETGCGPQRWFLL